ncbi:hypothetical protein LAJ19_18535 (plasmid) [Deinococcus taeanensis]|uniref:hypothetical protein n=1 Tax=Deinococcus taeanensis TaxID=2737050 RepID=UPI001CDB91DB|nr:hypothetical protein [Deinococcus taeanensis]UBV45114.1 hypothetical protein LAJ19_18535 [Deinococcus taeanensis]
MTDLPTTHKLLKALHDHDLDTILPYVQHVLPVTPQVARAHLSRFFTPDDPDRVDLRHQSHELHSHLHSSAYTNLNGAVAKPNTARLRLSLLSKAYTQLIALGVLNVHPMQGLPRPINERRPAPLITREAIQSLHKAARNPLRTALILIDEHALRTRELTTLAWGHLHVPSGTLTRTHTATRLSDKALGALRELYFEAGGLLDDDSDLRPGPVFPWRAEADLRADLFKACQDAQLSYVTPGELRRASLRDRPHTPESAGFSPFDGDRQLRKVRDLAAEVADATTAKASEPR